MELGHVGKDGHGLPDQGQGRLVLSHLVGQHSQQVQGVGLGGIGLQDLPVKLLRLGQVAGLVVLQGQRQRFCDRRHDLKQVRLGQDRQLFGSVTLLSCDFSVQPSSFSLVLSTILLPHGSIGRFEMPRKTLHVAQRRTLQPLPQLRTQLVQARQVLRQPRGCLDVGRRRFGYQVLKSDLNQDGDSLAASPTSRPPG